MKYLICVVALVISAGAQLPVQFQHIIIAIQENRTPDNLFSDCGISGADVQTNEGASLALNDPFGDFGHSHQAYLNDASGNWGAGSNDYVDATTIEPYCQLAQEYGFANRMFQTNQGPSLPSHQFLVSGSSAPEDTSDLFVSADPRDGTDCNSPNAIVETISPTGTIGTTPACFTRSSLVDLLVGSGLTWKYYAVRGHGLWDGVAALQAWYKSPYDTIPSANILTDISSGQLASVSWVTPTSACSDHPGSGNTGCGPAWISSIVDAVGESQYWQNSAILVTWDDWGGWYDNVGTGMNTTGWCEIYCYGFRVPLLVISPNTPAMVDNETHDFGSILKFVENNFNLTLVGPGTFADAYADDLSDFFSASPMPFRPIVSRPLTKQELTANGDLDDE